MTKIYVSLRSFKKYALSFKPNTHRNIANNTLLKLFDFNNNECQFFKESVLILKTGLQSNVPIVTNLKGKTFTTTSTTKNKLKFSYESKTEVVGSCGVTFKGQFYIYGGKNIKRQISVVRNCALERQKVDLKNDLERGACTVGNKQVYLCFNADGRKGQKRCNISKDPRGNFEKNVTESIYEHRIIRIASSESE